LAFLFNTRDKGHAFVVKMVVRIEDWRRKVKREDLFKGKVKELGGFIGPPAENPRVVARPTLASQSPRNRSAPPEE
jgi:hypothetical protein